jgi:carbamoyltransferase
MTQYLGVSEGFHDAGLALINDKGDILFAGHSERYSQLKNDPENNQEIWSNAADYITDNVSVHYYEKPFVKRMRMLYSGDWSGAFLRRKLSCSDYNYTTHGHHLSHAATAFQTSPFESAAVVIVDAIGEWDTITIWKAHYKNGKAVYKRLWRQRYPHSIGLFYSAMTKRVGLRPLEDEYVLMGMAAYGGIFSSDRLYKKMLNDFVYDPENATFKENPHIGLDDWAAFSTNNDIAAATQQLTEVLLWNIHKKAIKLSGETNLCYSGGVALNCVFNRQLADLWDKVWIPPNPGDCGSALGAAALGYGKKLNWVSPFLGYDISKSLNVKNVIDELTTNGVVGVANGRAEWGPRALGNRSLLADPRTFDMKDKVNEIKHRQQYRPFAAAVLEEHAKNYFDIKPELDYRYMQYTADTLPKTMFDIPAVRHVDDTSRIQIVPNDNSNMRKILEGWYAKTGCPVLLNTSLNIRHQPMVNTIKDAKEFARTYGVKVIV